MSHNNLFKGTKVLELASVLAGPAVGNFFSEMGAEVLKVENKNGGDVTRQWRSPNEIENGPSAYYASVNWNKECVFLDFNDTEEHQTILELAGDADIIISNFKKGDDIKFGLSYKEVKKINPSIIYGKITGFGSESDRVAYDLILQAEAGFMSINGQPWSPPTKMPLALIDLLAAHQLKEGILCAMLAQKDSEDSACLVEVSLYESAVSSLINQATDWLMNGNVPQQIGSLHPHIAPYGEVFEMQNNRKITLAIGNDRQFRKLCMVLNCDELVEDSRFSSNQKRVKHREELFGILNEALQAFKTDGLLSKLHDQKIPAGEIKNIKQVFESETSQRLLLEEVIEGRQTIRPKTTVFQMTS
ncbi:CaiB/BaiF CoA transferase family protein [Halalkalibaculum roseum]|uniref:CaiB/BaiF CoA transferase family protein n=1 Tax=Halalkalibaculum roseum TaxID=2709311 RepID=UPI002012BDA7|nr:CoA transferase [Halalkalibaculum roseum]